ncbi:hypothetical protein [Catellatospora methionotrophica]|uniref:hypothetical protein n=1 Tax=Catellatospora methionotrophica TaxID=121620 RepID=UPI00340C8EC9
MKQPDQPPAPAPTAGLLGARARLDREADADYLALIRDELDILQPEKGYAVNVYCSDTGQRGVVVGHDGHDRTATVLALGLDVIDSLLACVSVPLYGVEFRHRPDSTPWQSVPCLPAAIALKVAAAWVRDGDAVPMTQVASWSRLAVTRNQTGPGPYDGTWPKLRHLRAVVGSHERVKALQLAVAAAAQDAADKAAAVRGQVNSGGDGPHAVMPRQGAVMVAQGHEQRAQLWSELAELLDLVERDADDAV